MIHVVLATSAHGTVALLFNEAGDEPADTQPPCAWPLLETQCSTPNGTYLDHTN